MRACPCFPVKHCSRLVMVHQWPCPRRIMHTCSSKGDLNFARLEAPLSVWSKTLTSWLRQQLTLPVVAAPSAQPQSWDGDWETKHKWDMHTAAEIWGLIVPVPQMNLLWLLQDHLNPGQVLINSLHICSAWSIHTRAIHGHLGKNTFIAYSLEGYMLWQKACASPQYLHILSKQFDTSRIEMHIDF